MRDNYLHCLHPHYPRSRGTQHWPSLCWAGRPCQAPPRLPGHTPAPGEGWGMPREEAGMAVSTPRQLGPQAQSRFLGLCAVLQNAAPPLPQAPSPRQCGALRSWLTGLTNPAMQSGSLIANSFYGSWAHLCHHMQKERKKKNPCLKKKVFLPVPSPRQTPKETVARVFLAAGRHGTGTHRGRLPSLWAWQSQGVGQGRGELTPGA